MKKRTLGKKNKMTARWNLVRAAGMVGQKREWWLKSSNFAWAVRLAMGNGAAIPRSLASRALAL